MQQVAEISEAARHKQIGYDQNIASEIKDIKVQLVEELTKEKEKAVEMARKLLQNNFSVQMIVELTELTEEEINEIKLELH